MPVHSQYGGALDCNTLISTKKIGVEHGYAPGDWCRCAMLWGQSGNREFRELHSMRPCLKKRLEIKGKISKETVYCNSNRKEERKWKNEGAERERREEGRERKDKGVGGEKKGGETCVPSFKKKKKKTPLVLAAIVSRAWEISKTSPVKLNLEL